MSATNFTFFPSSSSSASNKDKKEEKYKSFSSEKEELLWLRQQERYRQCQEALKDFLLDVKRAVKDKAKLHLQDLSEVERRAISHPQVFLSYAWEAAGTAKLMHQQDFLRGLSKDLHTAGLAPWLDIERMTGYMDGQMRDNIRKSQYAVLIGTRRYAERTQAGSRTNVRKELDFALAEAKEKNNFLLPVLFEGEWGSTFPEISKDFLVRDGRKWFFFERGEWQGLEGYVQYIQELARLTPLGILPTLLGLNCHDDYPRYRNSLRIAYESHQKRLEARLEKILRSRPASPPPPRLSAPFDEKLQKKLIKACKEGDAKTVELLLSKGARADLATIEGEHPLGAAVWGMNPEIIEFLIAQKGNISSLTWEKCQAHNKKWYGSVYVVESWSPSTYGEWWSLIQRINQNSFLIPYHVQRTNTVWKDTPTWESMKTRMTGQAWIQRPHERIDTNKVWLAAVTEIREKFGSYQLQCKTRIIHATIKSQPSQPAQTEDGYSFTWEREARQSLQKELIMACEQGDLKAVEAAIKRGAKPNLPDEKGKYPLGAAVWGMNPDIIDCLIKEMKGVVPISWEEIEKHNGQHYNEIWVINELKPATFGEWSACLKKLDASLFASVYFLQKGKGLNCLGDDSPRAWPGFLDLVCKDRERYKDSASPLVSGWKSVCQAAESGYKGCRAKIKQMIATTAVQQRENDRATAFGVF